MKLALQISLCCLLAGSVSMAQRGGGGGGGMRGGGGFVGSTGGSGSRGGFSTGGFVNSNILHPTSRPGLTFRGEFRGFGNRSFVGSSFSWPYLGYYPYGGFGYSYDYPYYGGYPSEYGYGYSAYQSSPNVTVVYPPQPVAPLTAERARPVTREYDQNGQEIQRAGSPLYLIAFNDHTIRAAASYRVEGNTLRYVTPEREEKQAPLDTVDRAMSMQLNRERQIPFQLPPQ